MGLNSFRTACLIVFSSHLVLGQSEIKSIQAHKWKGELKLDGRIDEAFWLSIAPSGGFRMQEPVEGGQPSYNTEIRIAYDENNLYIGAVFYDDPKGIKAWQKKWDQGLGTDDRFMWILDTFNDQRNAFFFEINPAGLHGDGLLTVGQGISFNKAWNGIWRAWTHIGEFGWSAEIRIPFRSLSFNPDDDTWGINFQRTIRRFNEELMWTGYRRNQGLFRPQNAGKLVGLKDISQGLGLQTTPYTIARRQQTGHGENASSQVVADMGLDVSYNITPNLEASVTYNTDFAETEVDDRQINLTRFPLLFPERRAFFLQGSSIFEFAPSSFINPFFTRRVGLVDGNTIPITYGARVLGRIKDYNVAAIQVRTGDTGDIPAEHFTAARIKKNIFKESSIGMIYTRRSTVDGENLPVPVVDRHTLGADLELNTSSFMGNNVLQFQAFMVGHNFPLANGDTTSFWDRTVRGGRINFPNQPWSGHVSYREFGISYDPDMAFTPRNGFRRLQPTMAYSPLFEKSDLIRKMTWTVDLQQLMSMEWRPLTQTYGINYLDIVLESGDNLRMRVGRDRELLLEDFDILRDGSIVIGLDEYRFWYSTISLSTANYRKVQLNFDYINGEYWSGHRQQYASDITIRPFPGINLTTEYIHTAVSLPEGSFKTNLIRFRGNVDLSPFVSFSTNIQYDDITASIGINNRFRWIVTPGTDLFLVYNHNWLQDPLNRNFLTLSSQATIKFTYTHRF